MRVNMPDVPARVTFEHIFPRIIKKKMMRISINFGLIVDNPKNVYINI